MADTKGNDPKPSESKSGAVKPPVLDLTARPAGSEKSEAKETPPKETASRSKTAESKPATPPTPAPSNRGSALISALGGGVIGLAAAYGLAWAGLWPTPPAAPQPADPRIAGFASAIPELETVTQTTQTELAALNQRIAALESAEPAPASAAPVDLTGLEGDVAALTARIDALAAAPAAAADTVAVDGLRGNLTALATRVDELAARVGTAESALRTLDTTVSQTTATLADQPSDIGAVLQLPLILSGFETAFATGRPYATELAALRAAVPNAAVPAAIANGAETGLTRPDAIARRFADVLPDMLAARPTVSDGQWQDAALDWFRSAIALRPTGEVEGDDPQAVMSRLEAAIDRRDFTTAEDLIAKLPAPMVAAAGDVPGLIASQAEGVRFLDGLRASALSGEALK